MARPAKVLIVDDSAFVRKVVREMLSRCPDLTVVGAARRGEEVFDLVEALRPDVITLDLHMPGMDGLAVLRQQMARRPVPVVLLSSASESGPLVIEALAAGAVDVVQKPTALASEQVFDIERDLVAKVRAAAGARVADGTRIADGAGPAALLRDVIRTESPTVVATCQTEVIVIGVSTGGPHALRQILPRLPRDLPVPVAVVIHMPVGFTELMARHLAEISEVDVLEARQNETLKPGLVLIAPAGYHLTFVRRADGSVGTRLSQEPAETPHRPAVDVLFRSAAEVYGEGVLAVVLTGMGSDGTDGAAWIKAQGGRVFCEAEQSCVVYGMPRSVVEAGLCDHTFLLSDMTQAILRAL